jgi:IclR family transcriptional regulator, KDG regulon repressor
MTALHPQELSDAGAVRTLDKGLTILEELAIIGRDGATTAELSRRLSLHRTTVYRFLQTLVRRGYAEQINEGERFRVGLRALRLASASMSGLSLRAVGLPVLEALNRHSGETVVTAMLDPSDDVITIDHLDAEHPVGLRTYIGSHRPAYCTAAGKAMLAYLPEARVDAILARGMPAWTPQTITDPTRLKAQLWEVVQRGFAIDDEERIEGVRCVAAPVFDLSGRLAGAVSLMAPTMRMEMPRLLELGEQTAEAARALSRQLGNHEGPRRPLLAVTSAPV